MIYQTVSTVLSFVVACWLWYSRVVLSMGLANERRRYNVTLSLIGWAHIQNDPCVILGMGSANEIPDEKNKHGVQGDWQVCI